MLRRMGGDYPVTPAGDRDQQPPKRQRYAVRARFRSSPKVRQNVCCSFNPKDEAGQEGEQKQSCSPHVEASKDAEEFQTATFSEAYKYKRYYNRHHRHNQG